MPAKSIQRSIRFTRYFDSLLKSKVDSGQYESVSEVVNEGLRLLDERDREKRKLREMIEHGCRQIDNGDLHDGETIFEEISQVSRDRRTAAPSQKILKSHNARRVQIASDKVPRDEVCEQIKGLMSELKVEPPELIEATGMSKNTIYDFLAGRRGMRSGNSSRILVYLNKLLRA